MPLRGNSPCVAGFCEAVALYPYLLLCSILMRAIAARRNILFYARLRREDFSDKLNAPLETERGVVVCEIYTRRNARRVHSTVSAATSASTTGNAAHTPGTPHTAVSASSTGGMTTTPRSSEMAKP